MYRRFSTIAVILTIWATAGCSSSDDQGSGTTGRMVVFKTRAEIKGQTDQPSTNALGWDVTLTEAYVSVGALYYFSGDPVLSNLRSPKRGTKDLLASLSDWLVRPACAHPGHYIEGSAMGQMIEPQTIDLLGGDVDMADGEGITGFIGSARFTWASAPEGEYAEVLDGNVVLVRGTAEKDDVSLSFVATAGEKDVYDGNGKAEVSGCAFGAKPGSVGVDVEGDGTVTLTLAPSVWFDQVDFAYVTDQAAETDDTVDIAGTLAWEGFIRGVKKGTAYEFSYQK